MTLVNEKTPNLECGPQRPPDLAARQPIRGPHCRGISATDTLLGVRRYYAAGEVLACGSDSVLGGRVSSTLLEGLDKCPPNLLDRRELEAASV